MGSLSPTSLPRQSTHLPSQRGNSRARIASPRLSPPIAHTHAPPPDRSGEGSVCGNSEQGQIGRRGSSIE